MAGSADATGTGRRSRLQAIEDGALRLLFSLLLIGTIVVLGADAWPGIDAARRAVPDVVPEWDRSPVPMPPATPGDQVRRYSPTGVPALPGDGPGALPGHAGPPGAEALQETMTFRRGTEGRASAVGRIDPGIASEFSAFLDSQGDELTTLVLHSPGGSVRDAIAMARALREKGIATEVPENGYCASSCPLVFAGGAARSVGDPAWLGVHQAYTAPDQEGSMADGIASGQEISADALALIVEMGVDGAAWVHAMRTPKDQLYVFTRDELAEYGWIATEEEVAAASVQQSVD
ncbi:hypothetical protein [Amorphus orientalis]|uniref:ATP-dependent Clp protease proteolytic subunit n=1 Tax=Amorphus orientalis TaxID=649198 RepID=A0AAE3VTD6_9HYPH|nr:hypothetical protein [Amorphus orientalis]MDQ0317538.1 hypothetical protein [Amorphus orientalis]